MVGESASGKSLIAMGAIDLLGAGAGVVSGTTTFDGTLLQDLDDADWRLLVGMGIGVLFQDAIGSWDPLDVMGYQSGEALLEHTDLPAEEIVKRVRDALGEVGLPKGRHFSAYVHEVSRGQAQRAMLAATLLSAPRLLIADEPLSGLDVTVARGARPDRRSPDQAGDGNAPRHPRSRGGGGGGRPGARRVWRRHRRGQPGRRSIPSTPPSLHRRATRVGSGLRAGAVAAHRG